MPILNYISMYDGTLKQVLIFFSNKHYKYFYY